MWISRKKWVELEKRIAVLERQIQNQQCKLGTYVNPPVDNVFGSRWNASNRRDNVSGNFGSYGGGAPAPRKTSPCPPLQKV